MEAFRQIYESLPAIINVPQALRNRKAEIIILLLEDEPTLPATNSGDASLPDAEALKFAGCLPDFPERDSQF